MSTARDQQIFRVSPQQQHRKVGHDAFSRQGTVSPKWQKQRKQTRFIATSSSPTTPKTPKGKVGALVSMFSSANKIQKENRDRSSRDRSSSPRKESSSALKLSPRVPPISPAKSSATAWSGDSSFNPTGWPGTLGKRGVPVTMSESCSEDEKSFGKISFKVNSHSVSNQDEFYLATCSDDADDDGSTSQGITPQTANLSKWYNSADDDTLTSGLSNEKSIPLHAEFKQRPGNDVNKYNAQYHDRVAISGDMKLESLTGKSLVRNPVRFAPANADGESRNQVGPIDLDEVYEQRQRMESSVRNSTTPVTHNRASIFRTTTGGSSQSNRPVMGATYSEEVDFDSIQPPTEEALKFNDLLTAPSRLPVGEDKGKMLKGFRGFVDKTSDMPNLMDDSISMSESDVSMGRQSSNLGLAIPFTKSRSGHSSQLQTFHENPFQEELAMDDGQSSIFGDIDQPAVNVPTNEGGQFDEVIDFDEQPDLSIYHIDPGMVRKMVYAYRQLCTSQMETPLLDRFEQLVDAKKAFALFEMRSRIMEADIDRGLDRRGGANIVDDIVTTEYYQAAGRVRDAVIVSKAWRDGATPKDVLTAHVLTRRSTMAYFVKRPIQRMRRRHPHDVEYPRHWLEEAKWVDDHDFMLMRCQSVNSGSMKGFEMFTIGDCQTMLLKMTSDNCTRLRGELRLAMMQQVEAEEMMEEVVDFDDEQNVVAEAEILYSEATAAVKRLSMKLVMADKAFSLVRSRMEKLCETIETLLSSIDDDDDADTSCSESVLEEASTDVQSQDTADRDSLIRRAQRAEVSAEIAVRELLLAKQETEQIKSQKQLEIDQLKNQLAQLETTSQILASENRRFMSIGKKKPSYLDNFEAKSLLESTFEKDVESASRSRVKERFKRNNRRPS